MFEIPDTSICQLTNFSDYKRRFYHHIVVEEGQVRHTRIFPPFPEKPTPSTFRSNNAIDFRYQCTVLILLIFFSNDRISLLFVPFYLPYVHLEYAIGVTSFLTLLSIVLQMEVSSATAHSEHIASPSWVSDVFLVFIDQSVSQPLSWCPVCYLQ